MILAEDERERYRREGEVREGHLREIRVRDNHERKCVCVCYRIGVMSICINSVGRTCVWILV